MRSSEIQKSLNIKPLLFQIERSLLDSLAVQVECLRKDSPNKLYLPKEIGEDQLEDLEGPITLRIWDGIAWYFSQVK